MTHILTHPVTIKIYLPVRVTVELCDEELSEMED